MVVKLYLGCKEGAHPAKEGAGAYANSPQDGWEDLTAVDENDAEAGHYGSLPNQSQTYK